MAGGLQREGAERELFKALERSVQVLSELLKRNRGRERFT
jgi:hypothetical protein